MKSLANILFLVAILLGILGYRLATKDYIPTSNYPLMRIGSKDLSGIDSMSIGYDRITGFTGISFSTKDLPQKKLEKDIRLRIILNDELLFSDSKGKLVNTLAKKNSIIASLIHLEGLTEINLTIPKNSSYDSHPMVLRRTGNRKEEYGISSANVFRLKRLDDIRIPIPLRAFPVRVDLAVPYRSLHYIKGIKPDIFTSDSATWHRINSTSLNTYVEYYTPNHQDKVNNEQIFSTILLSLAASYIINWLYGLVTSPKREIKNILVEESSDDENTYKVTIK